MRADAFAVRNGTVVTPEGSISADVSIADGRIAEVAPSIPRRSNSDIDASGLLVLPGLIDSHLHFNEPGRTHWEGAETGSQALAAGGGTMFCDMPLNSTPCTVSASDVERKRSALEQGSIADFALWGGLTPGSIPQMPEMASAGVIGFKAFMCDSGLAEFPRSDAHALREGMAAAAALGLPVAVHAESEAITRRLSEALGGVTARQFLASRPVIAECEAVELALTVAEETRARLHIVHLSSGAALMLAAEARTRGVDVTVETCPHYLYFTEQDVERLGVVAKCAPPSGRRTPICGRGCETGEFRPSHPITHLPSHPLRRKATSRAPGAASPACNQHWLCSSSGATTTDG
jgi:allantoinase